MCYLCKRTKKKLYCILCGCASTIFIEYNGVVTMMHLKYFSLYSYLTHQHHHIYQGCVIFVRDTLLLEFVLLDLYFAKRFFPLCLLVLLHHGYNDVYEEYPQKELNLPITQNVEFAKQFQSSNLQLRRYHVIYLIL